MPLHAINIFFFLGQNGHNLLHFQKMLIINNISARRCKKKFKIKPDMEVEASTNILQLTKEDKF